MGIKARLLRHLLANCAPAKWLPESVSDPVSMLQDLAPLPGDHAPGCLQQHTLESYRGRRISLALNINAYMHQFLVRRA